MRVLLSGGGTAGHINPAIAIADLIQKNAPHSAIAFVGTRNGMENHLVAAAGYPLYHVEVEGLRRSLSPKNMRALWLAATSPKQARHILREFKPDLVIGTGGYVCWPLLKAAATMKIPCALHESNAVPGLTTRRLAPLMDAIWLNFKETANLLPKGSVAPVYTGNPLRGDFTTVSREKARLSLGIREEEVLLLSFGGSLGAEGVNDAMLSFMRGAAKRIPSLHTVHACGRGHYEACRTMFGKNTARAELMPYIEDMATYMAAADIVLCRAGAMTLSELALCGKCAILVPSPYVAGDHQLKNAQILANKGAAFLIKEVDLLSNKLEILIKSLVFDPKKRGDCEKTIKSLGKPDSCQIIWQQIQKIERKHKAENAK